MFNLQPDSVCLSADFVDQGEESGNHGGIVRQKDTG